MSTIEKAIDRLGGDENPRRETAREIAPSSSAARDVERLAVDGGAPGSEVAPRGSWSQPESKADYVPGPADAVEMASHAGRESDAPAVETDATGQMAGRPAVLAINGLGLEGIISPQTERSRTAEEFRMIKRPLLQRAFSEDLARSDHPNVIVVTSSVAGEGKTFTSLNLAISIAMELDRTVLLVDADLANPGLSRLLHVKNLPGLTEHLLDDGFDLRNLLLRTDVPKLTVLPAGHRHGRSTELLASNAMKSLLDELATRYPDRVVLFDSPPLLATSEASVLAEQAGQICLVVESATTPQFLVKEALGLLHYPDRVSLVLNKTRDELLSARRGYYYGYRYGYGYGSTRADGKDDAAA
jgi:exopolysaccharide/PEP-CTERM locus tyrosine autokinase